MKKSGWREDKDGIGTSTVRAATRTEEGAGEGDGRRRAIRINASVLKATNRKSVVIIDYRQRRVEIN